MEKLIKYSVIIPVYNSEKTIRRCLDSLLAEQRDDVEIIVVNDGSTDCSLNILKKYVEKSKEVFCIDQQNGGVSKARNAGLMRASGKYITFVDSDDYVTNDYFTVLDQMEPEVDICYFQKTFIGGNEKEETGLFKRLQACNDWTDKMELLLSSRIIMNPINKRFKREIIQEKGLRFIEDLHISEDFNFCLAYSVCATTIQAYSACIYYVDLGNTDSLSRKVRPNLALDMDNAFHHAAATIENSKIDSTDKNQLLVILDYLYIKNVCTCIAETFKYKAPNYLKYHSEYKTICHCFQNSLCNEKGYFGSIHYVMRYFLRLDMAFPFYIVTWMAKNRNYKRYRT